MPIDSRIPMMGRPIQLNSPLNMLARVQGIDNMRQTNALNAMQMQDAQAQRAAHAQAAQARQQALAQLPPPPPDAPPQMHMAFRATQSGLMPVDKYLGMVMGDDKGTVISPEQTLYRGGKAEFTAPAAAPKPERMPEIVRLIEARDAMPQGDQRRSVLDAYINKQTTHAPASSTSVAYGAPIAGVDAQGNPVFFQPDKKGGAASVIPNVKPPPAKLGEAQTKQVAGIDALGSAVDSYVDALGKWSKADMASPDKRAEMGTAYNHMMLQAKEAYNLGVLNGPDYSILQAVVMDPTKIMGLVTSNEAMAKQATDLKRFMNKTRAAVSKANFTAATSDEYDPLGLRKGK